MKQKSLWEFIFDKKDPTVELLQLIKRIDIFSDLKNSEIKEVMKLLHHRKYDDGEYIFKEGDPGLGMYIVITGGVNIVLTRDGNEDILASLGVGKFFGEVSLADASDRTASARAVSFTELVGFFRPELLRMIDIDPRIGAKVLLKVAETLGERLRYANMLKKETEK